MNLDRSAAGPQGHAAGREGVAAAPPRLGILGVVLALLAAPTACTVWGRSTVASGGAQRSVWSKSYVLTGPAKFALTSDAGGVQLEPGAANRLQVDVRGRGSSLQDLHWTLSEEQQGNRVTIHLRRESETWGLGEAPQIIVELPQHSSAAITLGGGDITAAGLDGNLKLTSGGGGISVRGFNGGLTAATGGGGIKASGVFSALRLQAGAGGIQVNVHSGSVMRKDWRLNTGAGAIEARLPTELRASLRLNVGLGGIQCDLPGLDTTRSSGNELDGELNGGGYRLSVATGTGGIRITAR